LDPDARAAVRVGAPLEGDGAHDPRDAPRHALPRPVSPAARRTPLRVVGPLPPVSGPLLFRGWRLGGAGGWLDTSEAAVEDHSGDLARGVGREVETVHGVLVEEVVERGGQDLQPG